MHFQSRIVENCVLVYQLLTVILYSPFAQAVTNVDPSSTRELDQFRYCMRQSQHPSLRECIGRTAINFIQRFDEQDNYTLFSDLVSTKDDKISGRSLVNFLDTDPVDFRGILENAGAVMGQRGLEWHMDAIYPGLMFKIGPTADANSVAQFVLDPAAIERNFGYEEPSTARLLAKQYLLPFLLGLKFNLVALVPLVFAGICLLLKKSLFLAKFAIYLSSFLGVGGALTALSAGAGAGGFGGFGLFGGAGAGGGGLPLGPFGPHAYGAADGYIPAKAGTFSHHYDNDELHHHHSPYKRNDRKVVNFEKTREYATRATVTATTPAPDRFYDYEKQVAMIHNRSGKLRSTNGKLGPSAYDDDEGEVKLANYKTTNQENNGWKVVDLRKFLSKIKSRQLISMSALTRGRQCLCVAGLLLQCLIILKCSVITVTITTPLREHEHNNNTNSTSAEFMTLRGIGRTIAHCLVATEQWKCFEEQLNRYVDVVAQDNSTWQLGDSIFVEPLTGSRSEGHVKEQATNQRVQHQRSLLSKDNHTQAELGIVGSLLQLAKSRSIRFKLPSSKQTLNKIGAGISDVIDGFTLENIATAAATTTEAAQADEARKKKGKDKNMAMMGGMAMVAMVAQMFLGKVILIAGAAFVMAKIALVISVLGSLKKGSVGSSGSTTERIVVTGQTHGSIGSGGHGGHGGHSYEAGWHRSMPHLYAETEIISEEPHFAETYTHNTHKTPPQQQTRPGASHQNHGYYIKEINEEADNGFRKRQTNGEFL
ncbi:uncharacterized protein LOC101461939 [Ceratitis capitata]|uniref:uncharacterized protein LOC101461939 n=1 Tax=Ceratitis capitata TaxID=7213 RepID=UPI000C6C693C|nr:uncharacterized protein LOC101461939 [Ceratitis capitata]